MLVARDLDTNALVSQRLTDLWRHWQENTLEFAREGTYLDEQATTPLKTSYTFTELADLPPHLQEIARHRYQLIRPLLLLSSRQHTKEVVEARIQTYLSSLNEEPQTMFASSPHLAPFFDITPRTVSRWIRRYQESYEDIRSLVPSSHQRGPRHHRFSPLLERFLQEAIKETYLTNVRAPVTHVITAFKKRIILENATRPPEEHLLAPGNMTVYRYIQRIDALDVDTARLGKAHAQRKHHQTQLGPLHTRAISAYDARDGAPTARSQPVREIDASVHENQRRDTCLCTPPHAALRHCQRAFLHNPGKTCIPSSPAQPNTCNTNTSTTSFNLR